jgi:hypothetical protein
MERAQPIVRESTRNDKDTLKKNFFWVSFITGPCQPATSALSNSTTDQITSMYGNK